MLLCSINNRRTDIRLSIEVDLKINKQNIQARDKCEWGNIDNEKVKSITKAGGSGTVGQSYYDTMLVTHIPP